MLPLSATLTPPFGRDRSYARIDGKHRLKAHFSPAKACFQPRIQQSRRRLRPGPIVPTRRLATAKRGVFEGNRITQRLSR